MTSPLNYLVGFWLRARSAFKRLFKRAMADGIPFMEATFDHEFYRDHNPDVAANGMDGFSHYTTFGYFEGRIARFFDSAWYCSQHPEVKLVDAAEHYLRIGKDRGFDARHVIVRPEQKYGDQNDYDRWRRNFAQLTKPDVSAPISGPTISVVMATYNPRIEHLVMAIESIRNQSYRHWELCIADDASTDTRVVLEINRLAALDKRIRHVVRPSNGHIAAATNSALDLVTGDFVAFVDQDDLLDAHALFWIVDAIGKFPEATLIYSDEDKIDETGNRYDPHFKPDFNYELLLSHNYIGHLTAIRATTLRQLDGLKSEYNGAQDYDLVLRVVETAAPGTIIHIPRVLYHWRASPGSTAIAVGEKGYASEAGLKALESHVRRSGHPATVSRATEKPEQYRVRYSVVGQPQVTIIIPTRDSADVIKTCILSLTARSTYKAFDIIVVDNGSTDAKALAYLDGLSREHIRVIRNDEPFNFSRLNNIAARTAKGEYLCCLNNDIEVIQGDWLEEMLSFAQLPDVGCVGARLWYPDSRIQHAGIILGVGGIAGHPHKGLPRGATGYFNRAIHHQSISAVTAACLVVRKFIFDQVGGFDEDLAVAFNDVDLCLRIKAAGFRNIWTPYANLIHHESISRGEDTKGDKLVRFKGEIAKMKDRWSDQLDFDPAYNPNLSLTREDFALAWPPRLPLPDRR